MLRSALQVIIYQHHAHIHGLEEGVELFYAPASPLALLELTHYSPEWIASWGLEIPGLRRGLKG